MKWLSLARIGILCILAAAFLGSSASLLPDPGNGKPQAHLRYVSHGHFLEFGNRNWLVSNGMATLRVALLDANAVTPRGKSVSGIGPRQLAPFTQVTYANLWNGIDLTYRAGNAIVESVYDIAPHADVRSIRLQYNVPLTLHSDGTLTSQLDSGTATESAPVAWQDVNGERVWVPVQFLLSDASTSLLTFAAGDYDHAAPLHIDPTMTWNTFLGGSGSDEPGHIVVDGSGNVYSIGSSNGTWGTPIRGFSSGRDTFVAKLDTNGALLWNTFLGAAWTDTGSFIALDANGNIYVTGTSDNSWGTGSAPDGCTGCPIRAKSAGSDAYVAKLDNSGNLVWNTFLGASGTDDGFGIGVNGTNVYVTGDSNNSWGTGAAPTGCPGCPLRPLVDGPDAFAAKLDSNGNLGWNTFFGGQDRDIGTEIAADANSVYMSGDSASTWGTPVRAFSGNVSAFAIKMDSSGNYLWHTFLGGTGANSGSAIAVDTDGNSYVAGTSDNTWGAGAAPSGCAGCPIVAHAAGSDGFAAKLDSSGGLTWNTFVGGGGTDLAFSIAVSGSRVYIAGQSNKTWGSPSRAYTNESDTFAAALDTSGIFVWNTFLGGTGADTNSSIAFDTSGAVYVQGRSSGTWGTGECTGCPIRAFTSGLAVFVAKLADTPTAVSVSDLRGKVNAHGRIVLNWDTFAELQLVGFNVWRKKASARDPQSSGWVQLNPTLIPAKDPGSVSGNSYRFVDPRAKTGNTYRYRVEVIYLNAQRENTNTVKVQAK